LQPKIENLGLGVQKITPFLHHDERGFLGEIFRQDWGTHFSKFMPKQLLISQSKPGIIRAWHRHHKNQIDFLFVRKGTLKICAYDGDDTSNTYSQLVELIISANSPEIVKIPGHLWHGTKNIGNETSETIYFINNLYDYENPDEERKEWNDSFIIDPNTKKPFDWNKMES
tara:strand:- start:4760 stop:5269 length:510 start_codon:yes stop_codon:yes gene_type:complete